MVQIPAPAYSSVAIADDANTGLDVSQIKPRFNDSFSQSIRKQPPRTESDQKPSGEEQVGERYKQLSASDQWHVNTFFSCYFLMTGLHGIHVIVGMGLISWILMRTLRNDFSSEYFTPVDLVGLYWHLVDLIWIFLFPLLYLIH